MDWYLSGITVIMFIRHITLLSCILYKIFVKFSKILNIFQDFLHILVKGIVLNNQRGTACKQKAGKNKQPQSEGIAEPRLPNHLFFCLLDLSGTIPFRFQTCPPPGRARLGKVLEHVAQLGD